MAGQLKRFFAFPCNPSVFSGCVRQKNGLLNQSWHTHPVRTKVCVLPNIVSPLCKKSLKGCFQSRHHSPGILHRPEEWTVQSWRCFSASVVRWRQITKNLYGCHVMSPGIGRASSGLSLGRRWISSGQRKAWQHRNRSVMLYGVALVILVTGFSYAAVPLYTVFCQATGLGGQATKGHNIDLVEDMVAVRTRPISIRFNADTAASMRWNFRPQQIEIKVVPGETALAFYSAVNPTDKPITGISTYNVVPFEAGQYFNKIQCFCFEEQRLNPREQVDMPVFFYIDPEFAEDPKMAKVDTITLSYTFFEAKEGLVLPDPFTRPEELKAS